MAAAGRRHSPALASPPHRGGPGLRRSPRVPLRAGDEVEVRLDGDGFFGTWYQATVVGPAPAPARGSRPGARYAVAYTHIAARRGGGGGSLAAEVFAPTQIRPRPPPEASPPRFRLHDFVEALDRGGWWSGIVVAGAAGAGAAADPAGGGSVTVAFPITREVIAFEPHLVRRRRDYIGGGHWVPSRAVLDEEAQSKGALMVYDVGDKVEVWRIRDVYGYSWFAATVTKVIDRFSYIVEYSEQDDEEMATEYLYWQCIRPAMDCSPQDSEFQLVPGAAVEAYCDGAWSPGVVHIVLGEDEYEVCLGRGKARQMVTKVVELLKPHYRWDGNCWTMAKPKRKANLRLQSGSGKRPSSPEYSDTKKSRKELQRQEVILAGGSEHVLVSETENSLSASHKSPASNHFSNSCSPLPGHSPPPNESITNVDHVTINEELLSTMVFFENNVGKVHPIQELQGKKDASDDVQIQLKKNKSCSKEINTALSASVECQTSSVLTRQVSRGTNGGSKMNVYSRKLKMRDGLKGPKTPQSSLDVKSTVRKGERKKAAGCKKHSSLILECTEFQTQLQLGRTLEDTLNLNEVTNQKLTPMVASGFELYNKKGVDTHSNVLDKGLTTTFSSICQVIRNEDVPTGNHVIETPALYSNQLVQQDQGNVNEKSIIFGVQNAGNSQCSTENNILRSSSISGSSMPSQFAVSQITDNQVVFVKNSSVWAEIEKMDVFKMVPQQPHFRPLMGQSPALCEAMALGLMATFASSVENIRRLSLADSMASFEDNCRTLCILKENGFNVQCLQNYLNRLVQIKTNNTRHLEDSSNLTADILEKTTSLAKIDLLLDEKGKAIAELEKNLSEHRHEVQKIAKEKEHKDAELSRLKAAHSNLDEACGNDGQQFLSVLAELQRKRLT